ncbi:MAG: TonB-dependent receptor [Chitinophagaceae bacterium]|nr:MAG: TonB-dependent receptor [Chitinophagaceae bacterium]
MKKNFFVLAAIIISSQLSAQSDSTTKLLDEVVVTANKFPNKTSLTGKVISVITKQQLEKSGGKDLAQILTEQVGLHINGANSNPGKDKSVYLRGARVDHTLITIDGVPVYDPSGIGGNFDIRNFSVDNIERIEILKGSQSTLYGSDALAGVINIITKKGNNKSLAGNASLRYGTNNTTNGAININGAKKFFDYELGYSHLNTDGINEAASNNLNPDKDGYTQNNLHASLGFNIKEKFYAKPYVRFSKNNGDLDQGAFTDELDYTFNQENFQAGVRNEFSFGKTKFNLLYNYNKIHRTFQDDSTKSRNGYDIYSKGTYAGAEHFMDLFTNFLLNKNIKTTLGVDYRNSNSDQTYNSVGFFGPNQTHYANDSLQQQQISIYGALNLLTANNFSLEAGSRVNIHSEYGAHSVFSINPSLMIDQKIKLFANLSTAYRTPSLFQLFSEYGNKKLKPESALTIEGGVQYFSKNNKWNSRVVAYNRNVKDVIFFYFNPTTWVSQYINQDKQNDYGVELEFSWAVTKSTSLKTFYNYVDGAITTKLSSNLDTTFYNLLRRPKNSFGINVESRVTKQFYISSSIQIIGERKDAYFDPQTFSSINTTLKNYALWNVFMEYKLHKSRLKIFADLKNITNCKFTEVSGFNTVGFQATGGVRFDF